MNIIKKIRKDHNLSQSEFAKMLNVHQTAVSQWENERTSPDISSAKLISQKFGVSLDELLGDVYVLSKETYYIERFRNLSLKEQKQLFQNQLTTQEEYLLLCFRNMSDQGKEYILQTLDMAKEKYKKDTDISETKKSIG